MKINIKSEAPPKITIANIATGKLFVGVVLGKENLMWKSHTGIIYSVSSDGEVHWYCNDSDAKNYIEEVKFISHIDVVTS